MMFWYDGHWAFWQASLMWVGMLVFLGLVIWAVYALITAARKPPPHDTGSGSGSGSDDARKILDQRLARGDIDEAEYQRLRDLISSGEQRDSASAGGAR